jgi:SulP family sulfate permease
MKMMQRTDLKQIIGDENFYWSVERVLLSNRPRPEQP